MPCSDQTELLELHLDAQERIQGFSLNKQTCHQTVGGSQLLPRVVGRTVAEALRLQPEELDAPDLTGVDQFLLWKQLFSLRYILEVYTGGAPGGPAAPVAIESIDYDVSGTILAATVAVDPIAAEIKSCGGCKCSLPTGSERKAATTAAA